MKQDKLPKEQLTPQGVSYSGSNGAAKELNLVKQLLMGAIYRTYDIVNMDKTYVGGEPTIEKGVSLEEGFEKQWEYILPHLEHLIEQEKIKSERSGMAWVHATVLELTNDPKLIKRLDSLVQEELKALSTED